MATPQAHINFSSNAATPFTNVIVNILDNVLITKCLSHVGASSK